VEGRSLLLSPVCEEKELRLGRGDPDAWVEAFRPEDEGEVVMMTEEECAKLRKRWEKDEGVAARDVIRLLDDREELRAILRLVTKLPGYRYRIGMWEEIGLVIEHALGEKP
jgi:hypothetical protein